MCGIILASSLQARKRLSEVCRGMVSVRLGVAAGRSRRSCMLHAHASAC